METDKLDLNSAKRLVKRICKAITKIYGTKVYPKYYSNKNIVIVSEDAEIAAFALPESKEQILYFKDAVDLIETMMMPGTLMHFSPLGRTKIEICTSKTFGKTIEEIKIYLDLLNV